MKKVICVLILFIIVPTFIFLFLPRNNTCESAEVDVIDNLINLNEEEDDSKHLTNEEIDLIALVTMAEAEGECEKGKRLVIDTILNRKDSEYFPNTIEEVIYQPNQFSSMWNGRIDRCEIRDDICQLVKEESDHVTDENVIFFCAYGYSDYGVPMYQVGNHYFSSYA